LRTQQLSPGEFDANSKGIGSSAIRAALSLKKQATVFDSPHEQLVAGRYSVVNCEGAGGTRKGQPGLPWTVVKR